MKRYLSRVGKAVVAVIHDPAVQRAAKHAAVLALARLLLAAGASAELVQLIQKLA